MAEKSGRFFDDAEYDRRRERVRERMSQRGLDALLVASPENINYLTGLDHMGYFACQLLVFPLRDKPILITRAMERAVVRDQVPDVLHVGYTDGSAPSPGSDGTAVDPVAAADIPTRDPRNRPPRGPSAAAAETAKALHDAGLARAALALDQNSTFLPYVVAESLLEATPDADWQDLGNLIDDVRIVQSPAELAVTRKAAKVSDSMMLAAIAAAGPEVNDREVMAGIYDAMFRRGGTYPGFVPLVRTPHNLDHEHGTWDDWDLVAGEPLFLEMSGCVRRYHAPMGRLVFIDSVPAQVHEANELCQQAMYAAAETIRPGARAGDVYQNWQSVLDRSGLSDYTRHHCGYSVGIGYPPSWSGSGVPVGLRRYSDMELRSGMVFHLMSWLLHSRRGDAFLSDTITVTDEGCEFLTTVDRGVHVR